MVFGGGQSMEEALRSGEVMQRRLEQLQEGLAAITAEGRDSSGLIQVTVGAGGVLTDVYVNPRAMRLGSEDLADGFKQAHAAASLALAERIAEVRRETFGGEDPLADLEGKQAGEIFADLRRSADRGIDDALAQVEKLHRDLGR
ncbi:YbaB/EbfC family nucleoid-associated protein [Actinoplanes philippinensis]|uniref:YbaB/EbfC family nucleoid-associated protein n=1 Tax=Actinoplanes philippinensis TaxID=35752 RepID=UPI0033E3E464